jgi:hypothetical protein
MPRGFPRSARIRAIVVGAQDVGKLLDQSSDVAVKPRRLRILHDAPRMHEETSGQCGVAVDQRTVHLEGASSPAETVAQQFVVAHTDSFGGHVPETR